MADFDIAGLGIAVDTRDMKAAKTEAAALETSLGKLGDSATKTEEKLKRVGDQSGKTGDGIKKTTTAASEQEKEMLRLLNRLDPVRKALDEAEKAGRLLGEAFKQGRISAEELGRMMQQTEQHLTQMGRGTAAATQQTQAFAGGIGALLRGGMGASGGGLFALVSMLPGVTGLIAGFAAAFSVERLLAFITSIGHTGDAVTQMQARIKVALGSTEAMKTSFAGLVNLSRESGIALNQTIDVFTRMARSSEQIGATKEQILQLVETIQKLGVVSGAGGGEVASGMLQLGQALASGRLNGDELRSIMENMPALAKGIADGLGVSVGQMRALGAAGQLTSDKVFEAIMKQTEKTREEFAQMPDSIGRAAERSKTEFTLLLAELDRVLKISDIIKGVYNAIATSAKAAADALKPATDADKLKRLQDDQKNLRLFQQQADAAPIKDRGSPGARLDQYEDPRIHLRAMESLAKADEEFLVVLEEIRQGRMATVAGAIGKGQDNDDFAKKIKEQTGLIEVYEKGLKAVNILLKDSPEDPELIKNLDQLTRFLSLARQELALIQTPLEKLRGAANDTAAAGAYTGGGRTMFQKYQALKKTPGALSEDDTFESLAPELSVDAIQSTKDATDALERQAKANYAAAAAARVGGDAIRAQANEQKAAEMAWDKFNTVTTPASIAAMADYKKALDRVSAGEQSIQLAIFARDMDATVAANHRLTKATWEGSVAVEDATLKNRIAQEVLVKGVSARDQITKKLTEEAASRKALTSATAVKDLQDQVESANALADAAVKGGAAVKEANIVEQVRQRLRAQSIAQGSLVAEQIEEEIRLLDQANERRQNATIIRNMQEQIVQAEKELELVGKSNVERTVTLAILAKENELRGRNVGLTSDQGKEELRLAEALARTRGKIDDATKASQEWSRIAGSVTDKLIDGFFDAGNALKSFATLAKETFIQIAKQMILRPIIAPIVYGAFGQQAPGGGLNISSILQGAGQAKGGMDFFSNIASMAKNLFSPDNFIANMFPSIFGSGTVAGVAGIGAGAALGVPGSAMLGAGTGMAVGGELAAMAAGPLAGLAPFLPVLAIALPLLMSFMKKESVGPNANAVINYEGGKLATGGVGADNGGDAGVARQMGDAISKGFNDILQRIGGKLTGFAGAGDITQTQAGYFKGKYFSMVGGKRQEFGQAEEAVADFIKRALQHANISGLSDVMRQAISRTTAKTLEDLGKALDFADLYDRNFIAASAYEQQLKALESQFEDWRKLTKELGLDMGRTESAISRMREAAINAFHGVGTIAEELKKKVLEGVGAMGTSIDKTASALDNAISQSKSAANAFRQMGTALRQTAAGLRISDLSPLSPADRLAEAQSQYSSALTKSKGGDMEASQQVQGLAQRLLELARQMFASGEGYTRIFNQVQTDLGASANIQDAVGIRLDIQTVLLTAQRDILMEIRDLLDEATKRMGDVTDLSRLTSAQDLTDPARVKYEEALTRIGTFLGNTPGASTQLGTIRTAISNNQVTAAEATSIGGAQDALQGLIEGKLARSVGEGSPLYTAWMNLSAALEYNRTTTDSLGTVLTRLGTTFSGLATLFAGQTESPIQNMTALGEMVGHIRDFLVVVAGVAPPPGLTTLFTALGTFATALQGVGTINLSQFTAIGLAVQAIGTGINVLSGVTVDPVVVNNLFTGAATWFGTLGTLQTDPAIAAALGPTGVFAAFRGVLTGLTATAADSVPGITSTTVGLPAIGTTISGLAAALSIANLPPAISALTGSLGLPGSGLQTALTGAKDAVKDFKDELIKLVTALNESVDGTSRRTRARSETIDQTAITGGTRTAFDALATRTSQYVGRVANQLGHAPGESELSQLAGWQWAVGERQRIIGAASSESDLTGILDTYYGGARTRTASTVDQGINEILSRMASIRSGAGGGPTGPTNMESSLRAWLQANPRQMGEGESEVMRPDQNDTYNALRSMHLQGIAPAWYGAFKSWWDAGHKIDDLNKFATGGSFRVGGSGGPDTSRVQFMATPGEEVSVRRPGVQDDVCSEIRNLTRRVESLTEEVAGLRSQQAAEHKESVTVEGRIADNTRPRPAFADGRAK